MMSKQGITTITFNGLPLTDEIYDHCQELERWRGRRDLEESEFDEMYESESAEWFAEANEPDTRWFPSYRRGG